MADAEVGHRRSGVPYFLSDDSEVGIIPRQKRSRCLGALVLSLAVCPVGLIVNDRA